METFRLEPRLVEYVKAKKYNEDNNIELGVPIEKLYNISKNDLKLIRAYLSSKKEYNCELENYGDFVSIKHTKFSDTLLPKDFKGDPRFDRIKKKMERDKNANIERHNIDTLSKNYDMYQRNFSSALSTDFKCEFSLDNIIDEVDRPYNKRLDNLNNMSNAFEQVYHNKNEAHINPDKRFYKHKEPKIQYQQYLPNQYVPPEAMRKTHPLKHNSELNNIFSSLDTYRKKYSESYDRPSEMDLQHKINIPHNNTKRRSLENEYNLLPDSTGGNIRDIDIENYVKFGNPDRKVKNYNNPFEHYYQFIDEDIQNHGIEDRPINTRMLNKQQMKPKSREIY